MRVLLLITDLLIGGTPTVVRELSWRLRQQGVDVQVACLSPWGPTADQIAAKGVKVTALNARGAMDVALFGRLARLIRAERIDVVMSFLVHANVAAAVARLFGAKFRLIESIQTTQARPRWHWWAQAMVQGAAQRIVVPSESVAVAASRRCRIPSSRLTVIPNAIDPSEFAFSPRTGGARIGFVGRLDPVKRIPDLIDATTTLPSRFELHIWGAGREEATLKRLAAQKLGGRCVFHGAIARPQEALAAMDVLVLPSSAEGFGLVLIEAMASGVPVVATNVEGIRDVVTDGVDGLLVSPGSPAGIAQAIGRISDDAPLRSRLIEGGRRTVDARFRWERVLPMYLDVLSQSHLPAGQ